MKDYFFNLALAVLYLAVLIVFMLAFASCGSAPEPEPATIVHPSIPLTPPNPFLPDDEGLASPDLAGTPRAKPRATLGALEA